MEIKEKGFSTAFALTVIFSLCVIVISFAMIVSTNEKKINSYKESIEARKEVDSIIFNIEKVLQFLTESPADIDQNHMVSLVSSVCNYGFKIREVSTGINKNFLDEKFLKNEAIQKYIISNEENVYVEYGWINPKFTNKQVIEKVSQDFENKETFPLLNDLPPLNIYFMSEDFISAVLEYYKIKNIGTKLEKIRTNLNSNMTLKELASILEINENHMIFDLIGLKSLFWKIYFETEKYNCAAVFAAVPKKEEQKTIDKYILIEKEITYKGGSL